MSALWGARTQRAGVLLLSTALFMPVAACEYSNGNDLPTRTSADASAEPAESFEENLKEVTRLLKAPQSRSQVPHETGRAPRWSADVAPGDYLVTAACAGTARGKLIIVRGEGPQESMEFPCTSAQERFVRHSGGPITVDAAPAHGGAAAAAGVKLEPNSDPMHAELADRAEWSSQALNPALPGESRGSTSSDSPTRFGLSAQPGNYELHFVCEGTAEVQLSVFSWRDTEVLKAVQVPCDGIFKAQVHLVTEGADFRMAPNDGTGQYAFRLVATDQAAP